METAGFSEALASTTQFTVIRLLTALEALNLIK
jgi:hypothetical protein